MATSRGTTPTYTLILNQEDLDLSNATDVFVTFSNKDYRKIIEKEKNDLTIDGNEIEVYLSQEETLKFPLDHVLVQVNWTINNTRCASVVGVIPVHRNLKEEAIT